MLYSFCLLVLQVSLSFSLLSVMGRVPASKDLGVKREKEQKCVVIVSYKSIASVPRRLSQGDYHELQTNLSYTAMQDPLS